MNRTTKLTLVVNTDTLAEAKEYVKAKGTSLSRLFDSYLKSLTQKDKKKEEIEISPFVKSLSIPGVKVPADFDYKKEIAKAREEKYA